MCVIVLGLSMGLGGVGPSDNYLPDSRSRYGESSIVNSQHTIQAMVITLHPSLSNAESLENHKDMHDHTRQR